MMPADVVHTKVVPFACIVACVSVGVITQCPHIKFDVAPKFIRSTLHSVASNKPLRMLILHSV